MGILKRFIKDTQGSFAISFAVGALSTIIVIGAAIDITHSQKAKRHLQDLNDNAALAAARERHMETAEKKEIAKTFVEQAFDLKYDLNILHVDLKDGTDTITVTSTAKVNTMMMGILGKDTITLEAVSEVKQTATGGPVEISFIFDTTASMNFGNKWRDVTLALEDMLKEIDQGAKKDQFRASLVPFSDRVNLGKFKQQWVDKSFLKGGKASKAYKGCVEPREETIGANTHALTNKKESEVQFIPSTVGTYGPAGWYRGGVPYCSSSAIVYPTHNINKLKTGLSKLNPGGTGRFDVGLAWGYRMLSTNWRADIGGGKWPAENKVTKVAVFLTDGYSIAYQREVGPPAKIQPWGWNKGTPEGFDNVLDVCNQMKAEDIQIHVIGVNPHHNAKLYFKACATSPEHYHDVRTAVDIVEAIGKIGVTTSALRLSR